MKPEAHEMSGTREGLSIRRASLRVGSRHLLGPIDLDIPPGRIAALTGPSGSGKSSLLSWLCGTLSPSIRAEGTVRLDGRSLDGVAPEKRRIGILFQDDLLFPHMSVAGNLAFGLPPGLPPGERRARVEAALAEAGLEGYGARDPATLSGGQRARVAVLRMLLSEPAALLLDEPFGGLDADLRARFRAFVFDHARRRRLPALLVTHDAADLEDTDGPALDLGLPE
jgi:putative thiamine transport system ATP-binding protein